MIIVSSIQKMNQLSKDDTRDDMLNRVKGKRLVFILMNVIAILLAIC